MDILKFLGSKWFTLLMGVLMACALPFTWHNVQVIFKFGQVSSYWYLIAVFICNVLAVGFAAYKFMAAMFPINKEAVQTNQSW